MKFFFGITVAFFLAVCFSYCTKNSVGGNVSPASIRIINTYYGKSFSLFQNETEVLSNISYNKVSAYAYGSPGYYFITLKDDSQDTIFSGRTNLQSGTQYSLFTVQDSAQGSAAVEYALITSSSARPLYDSCRLRFLFFARGIPYPSPYVYFYMVSQQGNNYNDTIAFPPSSGIYLNSGRSYLDILTNPAYAQYITFPSIAYKFGFYYLDSSLNRQYISQFTKTLNKDSLYTFYFEGAYSPAGNYQAQGINDSLQLKIISE